MKYLICAAILLSGCTINIVDKRLTREEVGKVLEDIKVRFSGHDEALALIATEVKKLQEKKK
jgi:hypothetical protein